MKKFKVYWNLAEEEAWLNEMAAKGYMLQKYTMFGVYHFMQASPRQLNYKIDYRSFKNKQDFADYLALFEDAGWQLVSGGPYNGSQYFLPARPDAGQEIFSDKDSAAARYKAQAAMCGGSLSVMLACMVGTFLSYRNGFSQLGFLTPGLWERTGLHFWTGFFFELPFVLFRVGGPFLLVALTAVYGYWSYKSKQEYERILKASEQE